MYLRHVRGWAGNRKEIAREGGCSHYVGAPPRCVRETSDRRCIAELCHRRPPRGVVLFDEPIVSGDPRGLVPFGRKSQKSCRFTGESGLMDCSHGMPGHVVSPQSGVTWAVVVWPRRFLHCLASARPTSFVAGTQSVAADAPCLILFPSGGDSSCA